MTNLDKFAIKKNFSQQATKTIRWHRIEHNVVKNYNDCRDGSIIKTLTLLYCRLHGAFLTWIRDLFKNDICVKLLATILCAPKKDTSHRQFADQLMSILTHRKTSVIQPVRMLSNAVLDQNTTALKTIAYQLYHDDWVHHNNLQNVSNQTSKDFRMKCCFPTHLFNKDRTYIYETRACFIHQITLFIYVHAHTINRASTLYNVPFLWYHQGHVLGDCWLYCVLLSVLLSWCVKFCQHTYIHTYIHTA